MVMDGEDNEAKRKKRYSVQISMYISNEPIKIRNDLWPMGDLVDGSTESFPDWFRRSRPIHTLSDGSDGLHVVR
jgi:hypothetical protein